MKTLEEISAETEWFDEAVVYAKSLGLTLYQGDMDTWIKKYYSKGWTYQEAVKRDRELHGV